MKYFDDKKSAKKVAKDLMGWPDAKVVGWLDYNGEEKYVIQLTDTGDGQGEFYKEG